MNTWLLIAPEIVVTVAALVALFVDMVKDGDRWAAWIGAVACAAAAVLAVAGPHGGELFGGMLVFDGAGAVARASVAGLAAVWCLWVAGRGMGRRSAPGISLALWSVVGGLFLCTAHDLITLFLAIELATMPAYVLIGLNTDDELSIEGALKYFLLSMLTSLLLLYGLSFVFGLSGSTSYASIDLTGSGVMGLLAAVLVVIGFAAKLSAAPFHFWAPDAYAGAPVVSVAFVSTVPKVAGLVALARLFGPIAKASPAVSLVVLVISVASMVLGNLGAYPQTDMRRLMAYSGIAHAGYLMLGIAAASLAGIEAAIFYAVVYTAPSLGVMLAVGETGEKLADFGGLVRRRPWLAWTVTVLLLSLIGVPPLAGFFGKLFLFSAALAGGQVVAVVLALVMSVVSAGYYFRIIRPMFFDTPAEDEVPAALVRSWPATIAIVLCLVATLALGVFASPILAMLASR
jgi:NADH-quinone oxidoreductase subunit N